MKKYYIWVKTFIAVACSFSLMTATISCSKVDPNAPVKCKYEHQCKGENERCIFDDPSCNLNPGTCEGICKDMTPPDRKCQCKVDTDCNYPLEGCADCKCYERKHVLTCTTDKDCGQGRYCTGTDKQKVCEIRQNCETDKDCISGWTCRERNCCNPAIARCGGTCKAGSECTGDLDCFNCGMICKNGACALDSSTSCSGQACKSDKDCLSCKGTCQSGYCHATTPCNTVTCVEDSDCQAQQYNTCLEGCCT